MFSSRIKIGPHGDAVSQQQKALGIKRQASRNILDIFNNPNIAAFFQKANEAADATNIDRIAQLLSAIVRTAISVLRETTNNRRVHIGYGYPRAVEPIKEMTCGASV
jgi:hypothetical protein